ncbi:MAG: hypothetical protein IT423_15670 [Pirellulaceae bacterium]|nr:hypothetical protein [Pirellulaceae bacterium]
MFVRQRYQEKPARLHTLALCWLGWWTLGMTAAVAQSDQAKLAWRELPALPDQLGLAGPIVGVHNQVLLAGGGANFAQPVWQNEKRWHRALHLLDLNDSDRGWQSAEDLPVPLAYSACVSTPHGIVVLGGNNAAQEFRQCWLLKIVRLDSGGLSVAWQPLPGLPQPLVYGQAVWIDGRVLVATGQQADQLNSATASGWELMLGSDRSALAKAQWQAIPDCPGGPRAHAIVTLASSTDSRAVVVIGGRRQRDQQPEFLTDVWKYDVEERVWSAGKASPVAISAGGAGPIATNKIAVVSGDDGRLFSQTDQLRDAHPGFPKRTWIYDAAEDTWTESGPSPANQVTTIPVVLADRLLLVSGEVRPRVRTNRVWEIRDPATLPAGRAIK